jgi:hypothetical protein
VCGLIIKVANDARRRAGEANIPSPPKSLGHQYSSTISYEEWNTSKVHWSDFDDVYVSSMYRGKGKEPMKTIMWRVM